MKPCLPFIFSFLLIGVLDSSAQNSRSREISNDSLEIVTDSLVYALPQDSIIKTPFFTGASLLYDYGKLAAGLILDTEFKQEIGVQVEFWNRLALVADLGYAELSPNGAYQNADYTATGGYYRLGLGYKHDMNKKNNFLLSARYGRTLSYEDRGTITINSRSGIYDPYIEPYSRENLMASWYEFVLSSETRLWKGLYAGLHLRFRVLIDYDQREVLDVFSIPGYGRTIDNTVPAVNLYIKYSLEKFSKW